MLKDYLESLKNKPVLRLDMKKSMEESLRLFESYKQEFPNLMSDVIDYTYVYVPKGWTTIVELLFEELNEIEGVKLFQVKQKFGSLRVYVSITCPLVQQEMENYVNMLIEEAVEEASKTCEFCHSCNEVTLFERGYVCRVCSSCLTMLCEYTLLSWLLNGQSETLNERQLYCLKRLRGEKLPSYFEPLWTLIKTNEGDSLETLTLKYQN